MHESKMRRRKRNECRDLAIPLLQTFLLVIVLFVAGAKQSPEIVL